MGREDTARLPPMRLAVTLWCFVLATAQQPGLSAPNPLAVAADSTAPLRARALALRDLGRSCTREDVPLLTRLGAPYVGPWLIWHGALSALSACPLDELAPFWRDMITFPRLPVRQVAIIGLLRTGSRGDMELIQEAMHRESDPFMRRWAERADAILRLTIVQRTASLPRR